MGKRQRGREQGAEGKEGNYFILPLAPCTLPPASLTPLQTFPKPKDI